MKILIAGCGDVGTLLGVRLASEGHEVFGLRRDPSGLPPVLNPIAADLLSPNLAASLPTALDAVVYAAAPGGGGAPAYKAIYEDGIRALLDALMASGSAGVRRMLLLSSTSVFGEAGGEWVDEDTPLQSDDPRGICVREGETLVLGSGFPAVVLRLGGIYGPGRTRLIDMVRSGRARIPPGDPIWTNRIHREDAARAAQHLLKLTAPAEVYVGVDLEPARLDTVLNWLAEELGLEPPPLDPVSTRDRANKRCSSRRLQESGFEFRYPTFREGYRELIAQTGAAPLEET
jgi:nucleoside-diphosphate-sugar epimerase